MEALARDRQLPVAQVPSLGRRIDAADDVRAFWHILRWIRRTRPDVVHTHTAKAGALGRLAAIVYNASKRREGRCAIVHTYHGHVFDGYFGVVGTHLTRAIERALAIVTDRVITISELQRHDIVHRYRIASNERVRTVALGLELEDLLRLPDRSDARRALNLGPDAVVVGYVGRLAPIKRVDLLLRACALARTQVPALRLVIAGDGETRPALTRLAGDLGMTDRVSFLGWRQDLAALYASMDVFALTSANEGTPVALIEALAAGLPVAVTAVGGVPDVVASSPRAVLIRSSDPADVAAGIIEAVHAPSSPDDGFQLRRAIVDRFGADRLVADIAAVYRDALARRRGAGSNPAASA